jgi:peroxiredoxin
MKKLLIAAGVGVLFVALGTGFDKLSRPPSAPVRGHVVPNFELTGTNGALLSSATLVNRRYGLLIFRPGCPHCKRELDELGRLDSRFRDQVFPVSVTGVEEAKRIKKEWGVSAELYSDEGRLAGQLGLKVVPALILINADDRIERVDVGFAEASIRESIEAFLE